VQILDAVDETVDLRELRNRIDTRRVPGAGVRDYLSGVRGLVGGRASNVARRLLVHEEQREDDEGKSEVGDADPERPCVHPAADPATSGDASLEHQTR
jgi:hypothetical protein